FGLKERGADISILNRTAGPAQRLAKQVKAKVINRSLLKKLEFDVIINATPVGMEGNRDPLPIAEAEFRAKYFFEMVYTPAKTKTILYQRGHEGTRREPKPKLTAEVAKEAQRAQSRTEAKKFAQKTRKFGISNTEDTEKSKTFLSMISADNN